MLLHEELSKGGYSLILASQSPRRRELLSGVGLAFETIKYEVDESYPSTLSAEDVPLYLARLKSDNFPRALQPKEIIITADTVVISKGEILGKPKDVAEAREMLRRLSGVEHQVTTGVCIKSSTAQRSFSLTTNVWFKELSVEEIEYYITKYSPLDKAGSYGIQEWIGYIGVERVDGSFYNVMGLPVQRLYSELCDML